MRIINYRTFFYTAINALVGAFLCLLFSNHKILGAILLASVIVCNIVLFLIFYRNFKLATGFFISAAVLILMLISVTVITQNRYAEIDYEKEHIISGTVYSVNTEKTECNIVLKDITIDGSEYKGKIKVYIEKELNDKLDFLRVDDVVSFNEKIFIVEMLEDGFVNTFSTASDIRYVSYSSSEKIAFTPESISFLNAFHHKLRTMLTDFMGLHYGNIAYSILSGNKNDLETDTVNYFSAAGLGHIMAVSGLHVGFLITLLMFCLKWLSPKIRVPIIIALIIMYMVFAGFSVSVLRAVIMSTVCLLNVFFGKRTDLLNNLSLAFTVILATSPFTLFTASFLMSICAVFGIACFYNTFTRILQKIKIPRFIASALSISASAQLGLTPCLLFFFNSLPLYSVIANVLMMPLIMITFILLLLLCVLSLISGFSVILVVPQSLLIIIDAFARFIYSLPLSQIVIYVSGSVFILIAFYFLASRYLIIPKFKWLVNCFVVLCCVGVCSFSILTFDMTNVIMPLNGYNDVTTLVFKDDSIYIVGDCKNSSQIKRALKTRFVTEIDGIYLNSMNETVAQTLIDLKDVKNNGGIFCPYNKTLGGLATLIDNDIFINLFDKLDNIGEITNEYSDSDFAGYSIELAHGKKMLMLGNDTRYDKLNTTLLDDVAILRCKLFNGYADDRIFITNLSGSTIGQYAKHHYSVNDNGEFIFDYIGGNIYK